MLIFVLFYQGMKIEICFSTLALPNRQGLAKLKKKTTKHVVFFFTGNSKYTYRY